MIFALLQDAPEPVRLVTEPAATDGAAAASSWPDWVPFSSGFSQGWMIAVVVVIVAACVVLAFAGAAGIRAWRSSRRAAPEHDEARMLRAVARACGLRSRDVALLRALASAHGSATPVALALCGSALVEAAERLARREPASVAKIDRLVRRLGVGVAA